MTSLKYDQTSKITQNEDASTVANFIYLQFRSCSLSSCTPVWTAVIIASVIREMSQITWIRKANVRICKNASVSILYVIFKISARSGKPITIFGVFMSYNKTATLYSTKKAIYSGLLQDCYNIDTKNRTRQTTVRQLALKSDAEKKVQRLET